MQNFFELVIVSEIFNKSKSKFLVKIIKDHYEFYYVRERSQ